MIEVLITSEMYKEAENKAYEMGKLKKSFLEGEGNITGFLGERIAKDILHAEYANIDLINYNYDLIIPKTGITIDVKTKKTKTKPLSHYTCGVMDYNSKSQKCDYYAFVRIKNDYTVGWFLGVKSKKDYLLESTYVPKGTYDKSNDFTQMTDSYNLEISKLDESICCEFIKASFFSKMLNKKLQKVTKKDLAKDLIISIKSWIDENYKV